MEDWESEDFEPIAPAAKVEASRNKWADEDVEEDDDVKDSWEDEEPAKPPPKPEPVAEKTSKPAAKAAGKKGKQPEQNPSQEVNDVLDPVAEKLRQQRLVEEADFKSTTELFGRKDDGKTLDSFIPKSESDFMEYAELLSYKIRPYEKSFHYAALLKSLVRHAMANMKGADAKEIASSVNAIANEKIKLEKETGKKKQGAKKKQLHVEKGDDEYVGEGYDVDDYDFM